MSKISDYLAQMRRADNERRTQTLAEFAAELGKPADSLLSQMRAAGVGVEGPDSPVSVEDKEALLAYLRNSHALREDGRPRIRFESRAERLHRAVASDSNGAERAALDEFASAVVWEQPIDPLLQRLVNLIVAKIVVVGSLPPARRGRPVAEGSRDFGCELAQEFWNLRDGGVPYKDAIGALSARHHKDERHLSRIIKEHTKSIGATPAERDQRRRWKSLMADLDFNSGSSPYLKMVTAACESPPAPELTVQDCLDHLSELLKRARPAGK